MYRSFLCKKVSFLHSPLEKGILYFKKEDFHLHGNEKTNTQ